MKRVNHYCTNAVSLLLVLGLNSTLRMRRFACLGERPQESKGTLLRIPVTTEESKNPNAWHAQLVQHDYAVLSIAVTPSAEAIVGKYQLYVDTLTVNPDGSRYQHRPEKFEDGICVLFNPWCSGRHLTVIIGRHDL